MPSSLRDERQVKAGDIVFRQGDPGEEMFVISAGRVRLSIGSAGHEKEIAVLGPGAFFGELSLLSNEPRSATAEAIEDSTLLPIARDVFAMLVQDDLDIVFRMMNIQGERLRQTNRPIQDLVERLNRIRIVATALKRFTTSPAFPAEISAAELAREAGLPAQAVAPIIVDLVQRGAGSTAAGRWTLENRDQLENLVAALCDFTEG